MTNSSRMHLSIDAHGRDAVGIRRHRFGPGTVALAVRTGPLLVYCLDDAAVRSVASAWVKAELCSNHLLPMASEAGTISPGRLSLEGSAFSVAEVVAEGSQLCVVSPPHSGQAFASVTTHWLTVRVHDRPALETYTNAWSEARALLDGASKSAGFEQLVRDAAARGFIRRCRPKYPASSRRP